MGVTIHYSGKLNNLDQIDDLMDELVEVSKANDWQYELIDTSPVTDVLDAIENDPETPLMPALKGIAFGDEDSEQVWMTFDLQGKLIPPMVALLAQEDPDYFKGLEYTAFTKTQMGGPEYHIKIVNLLKYISKQYFAEWKMLDESGYDKSGNKEDLEAAMTMIDRSLAALNEAFETHAKDLGDKSEDEIKDFIGKVLGSDNVMNINVIKLGDEEIDDDSSEEGNSNEGDSPDVNPT